MNNDWTEFLVALLDAGARFLVVGAHALAAHGVPRATQDLDVWIDPTRDNAERVWLALAAFGAPVESLKVKVGDFQQRDVVIQIGVPPTRIDLLTSISGVDDFSSAWDARLLVDVSGRQVPFLGREGLVQTKRATGRHKDLGDLEALGESAAPPRTKVRKSRVLADGVNPKRDVLQFEITLMDVAPGVWRLIEVPASYTFWDLHVAIQDAMGWGDYHLHLFRVKKPAARGKVDEIGIPDPDGFVEDPPCLAGWKVKIVPYFHTLGTQATYDYDFGDGWEHTVKLVAISPRLPRTKYPRCLAGERACPPEDCGGPGGYAELLKALKNPRHRDHKELKAWLGKPFDASVFDPSAVRFDDPKKRWRIAFAGEEDDR